MNRNDDGTHSFPPSPCSPTPCYDATPGSSSDTVAVAPRMRPTRNSQAWETGGSVLCTTARMARLWGEESGLSLAMLNEPGHRYRSDSLSSPTSEYAAFSCDLELPKARVRTPSSEGCEDIFVDSEPPEARAVSIGEAFFADSRPPEACARSLVEGRGRGISSSPFVIMNWRRAPALTAKFAEQLGHLQP
ncbi:hypothetical protein EV715DRAFT_260663 [Schizophyllum commune]